jgi:acetolactate synthase-1/2/3 large subunit
VASNEASGLTLPKSVNIARAYGIHAATLTSHDGIRQQIAELLDFDGPIICDVEITPGQCTAPRISSRQEADGSMVSCPLEDLWPFLDRDEFQKNMRIKTDDR